MRLATLIFGFVILVGASAGLTGCSSEPPGTQAEVKKPASPEELKEQQKKVMEGMKGMYKGAPGVPASKG